MPAVPILEIAVNIKLLAQYNTWMNDKVYATAATLPDEALKQDRGAFFGSIFDTLNHLCVGDTLWLQRMARQWPELTSLAGVAALPTPSALDQRLASTLPELTELRRLLDAAISGLCDELTPLHLGSALEYKTTKGVVGRKPLGDVLLHVFNHQTHHRGQVTTLLSQSGLDVGATDLILLVQEPPASPVK